ncbi:Bgt-4639 [Blumeria graminis f. sp. tritici]|uniref:tRNA-intron lyase n=2 Tax=Blumeria graminis f. sp. tritici TaxID=62690 RepID=A0A381LG38_BLUGR|nr:Subunit of the tRNA splicing endonuclease [Blumeria graminis f. sp. tritici 96224]VCU40571.1 Bgt-4639 [Blumeria graminis f. sp. tritici]
MEVDSQQKTRPLTHYQKLNNMYNLPAPFRVFPLPNLVPHNPLSLIHIIYVWLYQTIIPSKSKIEPSYQGWFSPCTRSVHVTDDRSIRGLWEQGFYGKGSLSRSEPNWLDGEKARRENKGAVTSEEYTRKRRAERQMLKWDRARKERQAIDQKLVEEAEASQQKYCTISDRTESQDRLEIKTEYLVPTQRVLSPVGPMEILSLPNSYDDLFCLLRSESNNEEIAPRSPLPPTGPLEFLSLPNSRSDLTTSPLPDKSGDSFEASLRGRNASSQLDSEQFPSPMDINPSEEKYAYGDSCGKQQYRDKRGFEGTCRSNVPVTAQVLETPKQNDELIKLPTHFDFNGNSATYITNSQDTRISDIAKNEVKIEVELSGSLGKNVENPPECAEISDTIANEEHFQLTLQEAFFLSYAFGCLQVLDPTTKLPIPAKILFQRCQKESHFPPQSNQVTPPDDSFLVNYVVYHHFRSLGWVVRSGIKFSVDYMLYNRGPVFSHAEFAILILPSYSDPYWSSTDYLKEYSQRKQHRSWAWMSCINRVITQVKKTLVLCYVDIPRPLSIEEENDLSPKSILARYTVREFILNRFLANRMRA